MNTITGGCLEAALDTLSIEFGIQRRFANAARGIAKLTEWADQVGDPLIVFKATGPTMPIETKLGIRGTPFHTVTPRQAPRFVQATCRSAKTDRVDAEMLRRMGAMMVLLTQPRKREKTREIQEPLGVRQP